MNFPAQRGSMPCTRWCLQMSCRLRIWAATVWICCLTGCRNGRLISGDEVVITIAERLRLTEALPLIEEAYQCGWANPETQAFEEVSQGMSQPLAEEKIKEWRDKVENFKTEREIAYFAHNWSEDDDVSDEDPEDLLREPRAVRRQVPRKLPTGGKIGRNDPCPCGSGKKVQEMLYR